MLELDKFPPRLKKVLLYWLEPENWDKKLHQICQELGLNYRSVANAISKIGSDRFYEYKAQLIDRAIARHHGAIMKALVEKAKKGNTRAIELYLKATRRLSETIQIQGSLDLSIRNEIIEAKKKVAELEK